MSRRDIHEHPFQTMHPYSSFRRTEGRTALALALATLAAACFADPAATPGTGGPAVGADAGARGCTLPAGTSPVTAPNGYYVNGATVCAADGTPHLFHGVDRPSLEFDPQGDAISPGDFQAMAGWNANVVRIALNQDYWLSGAALYYGGYEDEVKQAVIWAESAGLDVILDLHWSDRGNLAVSVSGSGTKQDTDGASNQEQMADVNSITFWSQIAADFKGDGRVMFELYNEPNNISWGIWLNGGETSGFLVAGMQQLYKAVRDAGAQNIVIAGGLDWAYDLSQVSNYLIVGYNIMYATHPYDKGDNQPASWERSFGYLATQDIAPVIATEFGDPSTKLVAGTTVDACTGAWDTELIAFADSHQMSWTAWAWFPGGCSFPSLISDWNATRTVQGDAVYTALAAYPPTPVPVVDAGAPGDVADGAIDAEGEGAAPTTLVDATIEAGVTDATLGADATMATTADAAPGGDDADVTGDESADDANAATE